MLLGRSILFKVSLVLSISLAKGGNYEGLYEYNREKAHEPFAQGSAAANRDYSRYFAGETAAPAQAASEDSGKGFVAPLDFTEFTEGSQFDGSNNKEVVKPTSAYAQGNKRGPPRQYRADHAELTMDNFEPKGEYFETPHPRQEKQREEEEEEEDDRRRPSSKSNKGRSRGYATEVHDLTERPPKKHQPPKKYKSDDHHHSGEYGAEFDDFHDDYPIVPYAPVGKVQDYNVGKSSSTVSQNPRAKGYKGSKPSPSPPGPKPKASTYKKVTYQGGKKPYDANYGPPEDDYGSSAATLLEYEPSASAQAAANSDHCKKVDKEVVSNDRDKHGRYKRQSMNCYVCQDPITKISSEECTYASDTAPQAYYKSASNSYKSRQRPDNYRHKRYSGGEGEEDADPYAYVKAASQQYNSRPKEFDGKNYKPKEAETESVPDYRYKPNKYFSTESDAKKKSFSEQKADELIQKGGENCEKVQREEMQCIVCVSAETGGNYEQCSYSSAPAQQKYAYVREQKFDGPVPTSKNEEAPQQKNQPAASEDEKAQGSTKEEVVQPPKVNEYEEAYRRDKLKHKAKADDAKKVSHKKEQQQQQQPQQHHPQQQRQHQRRHQHQHHHHHQHQPQQQQQQQKPAAHAKPEVVHKRGNSKYQVPQHFETETKNQQVQKPGSRGLDPKLYGSSAESNEKEEKEKKSDEDHDHHEDHYYPSLSEYHFKYFPDFLKEEEESKAEESQVVETQKKDVEEVLAEFAKKDRSKCQKAEKNGMTCYLCADENGLQHEECMYISESKPTNTHVAYHQKHELPQKTTAAPQATPAPQSSESREEPATNAPATSSEEPKPAASNIEPVRIAAAEKMIEKIKQKATKAAYATEQKNKMYKLPKVPKKYRPMKTKELTTSESRKEEQGNQEAEPEKEEREEKEAAAQEEEAEEEEEEAAEEQSEKQNQKSEDKKEAKDEDPEKNSEPKEPETPQEFKVGEKEGAFSDETQPVYSKQLGITLPKYMLTKSESEAVFDEFVKASS